MTKTTHLTQEQQDAAIQAAMASFPPTFRLRAFPELTMRIGDWRQHFYSEGEMQIVLQCLQPDGRWLDFGRDTPERIRREMLQQA